MTAEHGIRPAQNFKASNIQWRHSWWYELYYSHATTAARQKGMLFLAGAAPNFCHKPNQNFRCGTTEKKRLAVRIQSRLLAATGVSWSLKWLSWIKRGQWHCITVLLIGAMETEMAACYSVFRATLDLKKGEYSTFMQALGSCTVLGILYTDGFQRLCRCLAHSLDLTHIVVRSKKSLSVFWIFLHFSSYTLD